MGGDASPGVAAAGDDGEVLPCVWPDVPPSLCFFAARGKFGMPSPRCELSRAFTTVRCFISATPHAGDPCTGPLPVHSIVEEGVAAGDAGAFMGGMASEEPTACSCVAVCCRCCNSWAAGWVCEYSGRSICTAKSLVASEVAEHYLVTFARISKLRHTDSEGFWVDDLGNHYRDGTAAQCFTVCTPAVAHAVNNSSNWIW
jgi:hypothetical protein